MSERTFWVYFLASRPRGAIYIGVTSDVARRIFEHREGLGSSHVRRYGITRLVHAEAYPTALEVIAREKQTQRGGSATGRSR